MKRLLLSITCISLLAASAYAGEVKYQAPAQGPGTSTNDQGIGRLGGPQASDDEDAPARPVPEPGTMALASMGLIALGAAARKRRANR